MNININNIFSFYESRIKCHVESVNYFASLLGYHFPEHDGDKVIEPIRTGYAYIFYATYHKDFHPSPQNFELCSDATKIHHGHANHHIEHYKNVSDIPDVHLYEMLSDWASANFEQQNIIHDPNATNISQWFDKNLSCFKWSEHQLSIIKKSFEIFELKTDKNAVFNIWCPLLSAI